MDHQCQVHRVPSVGGFHHTGLCAVRQESGLGPLVGQLAFGFGFGAAGLAAGAAAGLVGGFLLAAISGHIYTIHLGYNLNSTGTTGGFVGILAYMMMRGFGLQIEPAFHWSTTCTGLYAGYAAGVLLVLIVLGFACCANRKGLGGILSETGKLSTDFIEVADLGSTPVNTGLVGLVGLRYILVVGGDVNGATLAGVLTIVGLGALGKHLRSILPVMLGVHLMCIPKIWTHSQPGPLPAAPFCTTLAPIAGQFGPFAGLVVGAFRLPMVMHVGDLHGYMNLYSNGFAGGLLMLAIVGLVLGIRPRVLDMHVPWYLVGGPRLIGGAEASPAED